MKNLVIFLLAFCFQILEAQTRFFFHHYTTDEGLPSNTIYDIKESPDGIITLGTDNGISYFNGQKFRNINTQNGLNKPFIIAIRYTKNGDLYMGNYMGKLQKISKNKISNLPIKTETIDEIFVENETILLKNYESNSKKETKKNSLAILFQKNYKYKKADTLLFDYDQFYGKNYVTSYDLVQDIPISINNNDANILIEKRSAQSQDFSFQIPQEIPSVFKAIAFGNSVFLFTNSALYTLNRSGKIISKTALPFPLINDINRFHVNLDKKGRIWVNFQKRGLFIFSGNQWRKINEWIGLKDNQNINGLFCDSGGKMWIATHENGLFCIPELENVFYFSQSDFNYFNSFFTYNDELFTSNRWEFLKISEAGLEKIPIPVTSEFSLGEVAKKPIFNGVNMEFNNKMVFKDIKGFTSKKSIQLSDGKMILFGGRELFFVTKNDKNVPILFKKYKSEKYYHIIEQKKGLLCNVGNRLFFAQIKNDTLKEIQNYGYQPKGFVGDILAKKDTILIAENNQLHFLVNEKIVKTITSVNGVNLDNINKIIPEKGDLWLATVNGLFKISKKGNFVLNKYNFLPENDVQTISFFNNFLFVATKNGLAKISLNKIGTKTSAPKISLQQYTVDGKKYAYQKSKITLKSGQINLKLLPEIINYQSGKNQFLEYKLDDGVWQKTNNELVEFPSFPYGNHRIFLRTKDVNSDWNEMEVSISKDYPFYLTLWFWAAVLAVLGTLFYYYFQQKIKRFKKKTQEEVATHHKMIELRQSALSAMMNPHFVFNSLNAIQYFVNTNQKELSGEFLAKLSRLVRLFLNQSSEAYIFLQDEITRLKMYVELEQLRFYSFDFQINLNNISEPEHIKIPNMILQPFLENAIIHGISHLEEKDGKIKLSFDLNQNILMIKISDNGFGLREKQTVSNHISKGISIIKERLDSLQQLYPEKTFSIEESPVFSTEEREGHLVTLTLSVD